FRRRVNFPVQFVTHPHVTFQAARCRNDGVRATSAPYLLFLDGDCVLPPDHVAIHLRNRRPGTAMLGDAVRLDEPTSARLLAQGLDSQDLSRPVSESERRRLRKSDFK